MNSERNGSATSTRAKHALRDGFDRATRWFGNLLAPLVIVTYAKDAQQAFDYVIERPLLTGTFALIFIVVLAYNVLRTVNIQLSGWPWRRASSASRAAPYPEPAVDDAGGSAESAVGKSRGSSLLRWVAILGSLISLAILVYVYISVFITGLYFVTVASAPDKASAIREIRALNSYFESKGYDDLEARAHASTAAGTGWYMISIGGPHSSLESAEATFARAKQAMGSTMRSDAYIYSTKNVSPLRVAKNWIRSIVKPLF